MSRRTLVGLGAGIGALAAGCAAPEPERQESLNLDFSRPEDNLLAWIKLASSLEDGVETCGYYKGKIIATMPAPKRSSGSPKKVFSSATVMSHATANSQPPASA